MRLEYYRKRLVASHDCFQLVNGQRTSVRKNRSEAICDELDFRLGPFRELIK